jgi:hypothetical protein
MEDVLQSRNRQEEAGLPVENETLLIMGHGLSVCALLFWPKSASESEFGIIIRQ